MNEELQKYLIEDLGRSFVTVPFGVYLHVCQEAHKEIGHKFPKLKMKDLTVPDIRLLYARYVYTMEDSCVEFLKSIITGYTDFQWPDEVNKLITQRYWMESEGKKRSSLDEEEVSDKPLGKRAKLVECCEDDAMSFKTESIESELMIDLDDENYFKGRKSPDFTKFHNPEPPTMKLGIRPDRLRESGRSGLNPTPPSTPRKSHEGCSSSEQFIDPRMLKRPQERRRSSSACSTPSTIDESNNSSVSEASFHSFVSDGSITEGIAKTADVDSKEWRLRKIAPYPHSRDHKRAEISDFKVVLKIESEDPRDLTQGYPRLSRPDRLPREPTEDCKMIPLNYIKDNVQAPHVSEAQLKSSGLFDWKLGESESPNGSPKSFYDGDVKTEEEDEDSDAVIREDVVEEGEDVDPNNFHNAYTRRKKPETELEPPPVPPPMIDSLPKFELSDIYRPHLLPTPGFPPPFISVPPPMLSPIPGSVPLPAPANFHNGGGPQYWDQSGQARQLNNNNVGRIQPLFTCPPPAMNFPPPQMPMNVFPPGVPFHYLSTGQFGNLPRQEIPDKNLKLRLSQSF